MFDIDKILGNKKHKTNIKFSNITLSKTFGSNPFSDMIGKFTNKSLKNMGASIQKQQQWKSFSEPKRNLMRTKYKDTDGDRIPNIWDCQPRNIMRQDFALSSDQYDFDKGKFKFDDERKVVMMPVDKLYDMRGRYNIKNTSFVFDDYKKDDAIKQNMMDASGKKSWEFTSDDVMKHKSNSRKADLKQQGYKVQSVKKTKDGDYNIKYRRSPNKYKKELQHIMSPTNTDESRSGSLGDKKLSEGATRQEAGNAERKFHIESMTDAVMVDSADVPMITIYGDDFKQGGTIGEGRHRIIAAKAAGLKEIPVFVESNNRLPKGALDKYRELTSEEIGQYSNKHRISGKYKTGKKIPIDYSNYKENVFHPTPDFDIGYDDYKDKRTPEEIEHDEEIELMLLRDKYLREKENE
jgi:hypothetical protein